MTNAAFALKNLRSILLPVTTPFRSDLVDHAGLRSNLDRWASTGIGGFVVLGSTGERVHLDEREYLEVIETARRVVPSSMAFIAGAGQQSVVGTIREIQKAAELGADAVLVITPHYYRAAITQETLVAYYTAVADAAPVPVLLYSMPALTGIKIEPQTIACLSEHPNIKGVKDSSNEIAGFAATVKICPADFAVMTGNGTVLFDALCAGATGAILAVGCVAPEICVEIFNAFISGDEEHASSLQAKLTPLATAVTTRYGIGGLKIALDLAGYQGGDVRAPLRAPDQAARDEIARLLADVRAAG
ncbi:MAG TPA: dihydrodipicolinate synthase family protein [Pyrinomonadaceae bacterium]|jgi:4-hydroxy-2-oxoglutarate aldolase